MMELPLPPSDDSDSPPRLPSRGARGISDPSLLKDLETFKNK